MASAFGDAQTPDGGRAADRDPILDLIRRGQADGVFDPGVSAEWIRTVVWGLVYTGCEAGPGRAATA